MTYKELHTAFELEATANFMNIDNKPMSKEIEYWLNIGVLDYVKRLYSGYNTRSKAFEQEQKRIDDLRTLIQSNIRLYSNVINNEEYETHELPSNYLFLLGDRVGLLPLNNEALDCWETDNEGMYVVLYTDPIQATIDNIDQKRNNKLSDHLYHKGKAKPLRLQKYNSLYYVTDGNYMVDHIILSYLRKPNKIDIHTNPKEEYNDMPEHTHSEIVKSAVRLYLENKANPRYQSYNNEPII